MDRPAVYQLLRAKLEQELVLHPGSGAATYWLAAAARAQGDLQGAWDAAARTYTLTVEQSCPATPGQSEKAPMHIPLSMGLLDGSGHDLGLQLEGENAPTAPGTRTLDVTQRRQTFRFVNLPA